MHDLPARGRDGDLEELVEAREQRHEPEQERDRVHGRVVPLEDDQRKDEPRDPGQQEEPPALGGFFEHLSLLEHHGASIRGAERDSCNRSRGQPPPRSTSPSCARKVVEMAQGLKTTELGSTGMEITRVGFGAWAIGGGGCEWAGARRTTSDSVAAIHRALELGVNWIDTAAQYGFGHSEEVVGRALAGPATSGRTSSPSAVSPRGPDRATLHRPEARRAPARVRGEPRAARRRRDRPLPDPLADPRRADRGRLGGARRVQGARGTSATSASPTSPSSSCAGPADRARRDAPAAVLADRRATSRTEILPFAERKDIGVIVYSPMGSGLLTGAMTPRAHRAPARRRLAQARARAFREPQLSREPRARRAAAASSPSATTRLPARSPSPGRSAIPPWTPRSSASASRPGRLDRGRCESRARRGGRRGDRGVSVRARPRAAAAG